MKLNNHQKGVLLILVSVTFFGITSIANKSLTEIPTFQKLFIMNLIASVFMFFRKTKNLKSEISKNKTLLIIRASLGFISTLTYFYAINNLPLADATLLNKTSQIGRASCRERV